MGCPKAVWMAGKLRQRQCKGTLRLRGARSTPRPSALAMPLISRPDALSNPRPTRAGGLPEQRRVWTKGHEGQPVSGDRGAAVRPGIFRICSGTVATAHQCKPCVANGSTAPWHSIATSAGEHQSLRLRVLKTEQAVVGGTAAGEQKQRHGNAELLLEQGQHISGIRESAGAHRS